MTMLPRSPSACLPANSRRYGAQFSTADGHDDRCMAVSNPSPYSLSLRLRRSQLPPGGSRGAAAYLPVRCDQTRGAKRPCLSLWERWPRSGRRGPQAEGKHRTAIREMVQNPGDGACCTTRSVPWVFCFLSLRRRRRRPPAAPAARRCAILPPAPARSRRPRG